MGGSPVRGGDTVRIVNHEVGVPYLINPAGMARPPRPDLIVATTAPIGDGVKARPDILAEEAIERFEQKKVTESNPFADLQIVVNDDDDVVAAEIVSEEDEEGQEIVATPDEILEQLLERDIKFAKLSEVEFNALQLSKKQLWHLHEQVIGRTVNKPTVAQGIQNILKSANSNGANYRRVVDAIKRVRDRIK
jgi:hypothetical protein